MAYPIIFYYGFFSILSQIILLKELAVLFAGQELFFGFSLASWLLWTGIGNYSFSYLKRSKYSAAFDNNIFFSTLLILTGLLSILSLILIRLSKLLIPAGQLPGLTDIFLFSLLTPSLSCVAIGFLFNYISTTFFDNDKKTWVYIPYILETSGAICAGLIYTFYIAGRFENFEVMVMISFIMLLLAWLHHRPAMRSSYKFPWVFYLFVFIFIGFSFKAKDISKITKEINWKGYNVLLSKESKYNDTLLIKRAGAYSIVSNGVITTTFPDIQSFEEKVHWPMLAHSDPKSILVSGQLIFGLTSEILKYPVNSIKFVEKDDVLLDMGRLSESFISRKTEAKDKLEVVNQDLRRYLKTSRERFDVILLNLPQPFNLEFNRFYTKEFFHEVRNRLKSDGILSFQIPAQENYLTLTMQKQIKSIFGGLSSVFENIELIPGDAITVIASNDKIVSVDGMAEKYKKLELNNIYLNPNSIYLKWNSKTRRDKLDDLLKVSGIKPNSDIDPSMYRYSLKLWLEKFSSPVFLVISGIILFIVIKFRKKLNLKVLIERRYSIFWFSLVGIIVEVVLILLLQSIYGYVYYYLGLLFAIFMTGMLFGSIILSFILERAERFRSKSNDLLYIVFAFFLMLLALSMGKFSQIHHSVLLLILYLSMFLDGFLIGGAYCVSGFSFPEKDGISQSIGRLYSADLWGGCAGLFLLSTLLINILSFQYIFALLAICIVMLLVKSRQFSA
ncbi:MAG: hypothetical protein ABII27_03420 [bacterium]